MIEQLPKSEPVIELVYWKMRGTAQVVRNVMEFLQIPYKQTFVDPPKQFDMKYIHTAMHTLPILRDQDFEVTEVVPIVKYLCKKAGRQDFLGKTAFDSARIEEMLIRQLQFKNTLMMQVLPSPDLTSQDPNKRVRFIKQTFSEPMIKNFIGDINSLLSSNRWALGYMSVLDFFFYQLSFSLNGFFPQLRQMYQFIYVSHKEKFQNLPKMKQYFNSDRLMKNMTLSKISTKWKGDSKYA